VVRELKQIDKPFVMVLNSKYPYEENTVKLRDALEEKYNVPVLALDALNLEENDIYEILSNVLFEFPITEIKLDSPKWIYSLDEDHWLINHIISSFTEATSEIARVREIEGLADRIKESDFVKEARVDNINLGTGHISVRLEPKEGLFYKVLGEECGFEIKGDYQMIGLMKQLAHAKKEYDRLEEALKDVRETGYGLVPPTMDELTLEEPEIIKQGGRFGVRLRASAPSLHLMRADIETEVSPIVGTEKQSEELVKYLLDEFETDPSKLWDSNIFGKSLHELVNEGLSNKLMRMPEDAQLKIQETLQRIINDGSGGLICIIL